MNDNSPLSVDRDDRLAEVLDAYLAAQEGDAPPDVDEFLARYPDLADELRECLASLAFIRRAGNLSVAGEAAAEGQTAGGVLGDFRILREVGKGGIGLVYEAEQISLRRRVALKVLPFAATMDPRHLQRFHNEAQAAACLHHTNIVPVHFVGCERGVHFYAMQFIDGQPLSDLIRQLRGLEQKAPTPGMEQTLPYQPAEGAVSTPLPAAEVTPLTGEGRRGRDYFRKVAELGIQAAEALDYAHQLGIVHRDIKPGNLLLDGRGRLWVTDFGLAQMQQSEANLTVTGQALGTPRYMSPEQALGTPRYMSPEQALAKRVPIDHRTDVYSLGATLYELLTLQPAFPSEDRQELLRQVASDDPTRPRRLERAIPAELEIIVLKAMEKLPQDRYATAQELADDLRRWLEDRPIQARRPTWRQVAAKWARRHKAAVRAALVSLILAVALLGVSTAVIWRSKQEAERARDEKSKALISQTEGLAREKHAHYRSRIALADCQSLLANFFRADAYLDACLEERQWEWHYLKNQLHSELRIFTDTLRTMAGEPTHRVAFSQDGKPLLAGSTASVRVWNVDTFKKIFRNRSPERLPGYGEAALSPDGRLVLAPNRSWGSRTASSHISLWDLSTSPANEVHALPVTSFSGPQQLLSADFSPDNRWLALGRRDGRAILLDAQTGQEVRCFGPVGFPLVAVVFSPDGKRLAAGTRAEIALRVWDVGTGEEIRTVRAPSSGKLAWSPDGRLLVTFANRTVNLWDANSGKGVAALESRSKTASVAFSSDGQRLAVGTNELLSVWDVGTRRELFAYPVGVQSLAYSPDGRFLAALSAGRVRLFDARTGPGVLVIPGGKRGWALSVAFSSDSRQLAAAFGDGTVRLYDAATGVQVRALRPSSGDAVRTVAFSSDGLRLASAGSDSIIQIWKRTGGSQSRRAWAIAQRSTRSRLARTANVLLPRARTAPFACGTPPARNCLLSPAMPPASNV
jgi:serine/threonine protein kinase/WD40 repeat protein